MVVARMVTWGMIVPGMGIHLAVERAAPQRHAEKDT
jgi:hypothetical protein